MEYFVGPKNLPPIPTPTDEEIRRMHEMGRKNAEEIERRLEEMFRLKPEDYFFVHQ